MKTHTIKTYQFSELPDEAKEKAIENNRGWNVEDTFWSDCVIDDAKEIADTLGITISKIYWSGFWSQGDGAMFEGDYKYKKGAAKKIREQCPQETELHNIADRLQAIQKSAFYGLTASTKHCQYPHYYHEKTMEVSVYHNSDRDVTDDEIEELTDTLQDFAIWIYRSLERDYEYLTSDEAVKESLESNEMEFTIEGNNYRY